MPCSFALRLTTPCVRVCLHARLLHPFCRYGSGAKSRWYKAQADRNKGLLAQLGDIDEKDEEDGGKAAKVRAQQGLFCVAGWLWAEEHSLGFEGLPW